MQEKPMQNTKESKLTAVVMTALTAAGILSGAIAVPLLCRWFYYVQIGPLKLTARSGLTVEQIKDTYNEIMDYCLGKADAFSLTNLPWSEDGASHFADVRGLFLLDLGVAAVAVLLLVAVWLFCRQREIRPYLFKGHNPGFWAAAGIGIVFLLLGVFAAVDFDQFFTAFHTVFFPGKDNWIFSYLTDPVIRLLPEAFFRNCALLVFALVIGACGILLLKDHKQKKK